MSSVMFASHTRLKTSGDALLSMYKTGATVFKTTGRGMMGGMYTVLAKTSACTRITWVEVEVTGGEASIDAKRPV